MSSGKRILLLFGSVVAAAGLITASVLVSRGRKVTVQTTRAVRGDIAALVTASGEITPKTYADISANALGQITDLYVKEGDHVHTGQVLARLWNIQQAAAVTAAEAAVKTAQANLDAQAATVGTAQAALERDKAQLLQAKDAWARNQALFEDQLIARQDFETDQATYATAVAQEKLSEASLKQQQATYASLEADVNQAQANLKSARDVLAKTEFDSPLDGVVTYLPVHVGDTVVMGIENSPGSEIMRVADMSVVTAEVQVDETDIATIHLGQPATLTIDAFGDKTFHGTVTQVGDTAMLRSTGAAATSSTGSDAQQAKDFQVVVTLSDPPANIRPGLSCTAQVTTATARQAVSVPLQAIVERDPADLNPAQPGVAEAASADAVPQKVQPVEGLFVVRQGRAEFVKAATGVVGVDQIQVLEGVQPGDEIITGPYKALRTLKNHAPVTIDNSGTNAAQAASASSS